LSFLDNAVMQNRASEAFDVEPFALFAGVSCDAYGGWEDWVLSGTLAECRAELTEWGSDMVQDRIVDWAHIVCLRSCKIVFEAGGQQYVGDGIEQKRLVTPVLWIEVSPDA
jgi:hypothetical protein